MFLRTNPSQTGYRGTSQVAGGPFLMVFCRTLFGPSQEQRLAEGVDFQASNGKVYPRLRAAVRSVRMSQCGHFMMGSAQLGKHRITLSGSYGADGLTIDPDSYPGLWETLLPVPDELAEKFWQGGGHNSAGSEGPAMRAWATANEKALRKAGKP